MRKIRDLIVQSPPSSDWEDSLSSFDLSFGSQPDFWYKIGMMTFLPATVKSEDGFALCRPTNFGLQ